MQTQTLEVTTYREYYLFEYKQSEYTLREYCGGWELSAKRKNYGGHLHIPSYRQFKTLEEIEKSIKGLKGLSGLINEMKGTA